MQGIYLNIREEEVSIAKMLLKKHKALHPVLLQSKLKITHAHAEKLIQLVIKDVFSKQKKAKPKGKMSTYELKAHQRLAEVELANSLLNTHARLLRQGIAAKDHLDQIIFELELISKKPIVPVAQLEED